jgi:thermitase
MVRISTFRHAPPERRRTADQIAAERAVVRRQMERWVAAIRGEGIRALARADSELLSRRRSDTTLQRFEPDGESGALVASCRLVVRGGPIDEPLRRDLAAGYGLHEVGVPGLPELRVLEEVAVAGGPTLRNRTCSVARELRGRELDVAPVHMVPLGAVKKAEGGPEPSGPQPGEPTWTRPEVETSGPRVALVDTGVSAEQRSDGWLRGLARTDNIDPLNAVPVDDYLDQGAGHGQFAAGIVQQVAPGADVDIRRGLDSEGLGDEVVIAQLIAEAVAAGARIVNLSLGTVTADDRPPIVLESAIRAARDAGALVVCAAGNNGDTRRCWPAAFHAEPGFERTVVSVGALRLGEDDDDAIGAEWSSHGDWVECSTFGEGVISTYVVGRENPAQDREEPDVFGPASWATWSGTSFAAPQIVGAIVRLMQEDPTIATAREALDLLLEDGTEIAGYGRAIRILPV